MSTFGSFQKRCTAAALAGFLIACVPAAGCNTGGGQTSGSSQVSGSTSTVIENSIETKFGNNVVIKSDHYQFTYPVVNHLFNLIYQRFVNSYGTSYIDESQPLNQQYYSPEENITWQDYFVDQTQQYMVQIMTFAEAAQAAGVKLTDEDMKSVEENFTAMESVAAESSMTLDEYITQVYGTGISKADITAVQEMSLLASKYSQEVYDGFTYSAKDLEDYYNAHQSQFQYADYGAYTFQFAPTGDASAKEDEETKKKMMEYAEGLKNCTTQAEFEDFLRQYFKSNPSLVSITTDTSDPSVTEDTFNNAVEEKVTATVYTKSSYEVNTDTGKWVFDSARKAGDSTIISSDTGYTAVLMINPAYRDTSTYKNVRHILIKGSDASGTASSDSDSRTDAEAKALAQQIYDEWKSGEASENSFAELAKKYTEDPGSKDNGGLYENVYEGQMVDTFNDWTFDPTRKGGDSGIVKTQYGYHIMYFVGNTRPVWELQVDSTKRYEDRMAKYEEFSKKYTIDVDETAIKKVYLMTTTTESIDGE